MLCSWVQLGTDAAGFEAEPLDQLAGGRRTRQRDAVAGGRHVQRDLRRIGKTQLARGYPLDTDGLQQLIPVDLVRRDLDQALLQKVRGPADRVGDAWNRDRVNSLVVQAVALTPATVYRAEQDAQLVTGALVSRSW